MLISHAYHFIRDNHYKTITLLAYRYAIYYRICLLLVPMTRMEQMMGVRGEESGVSEPLENLKQARRVGIAVDRVTQNLPLKRKCWVRALTARKILMRYGLNSTLYMGVGLDEGKMIAHAWLRCGQLYVTGGNGEGYSTVARFRAF